ncbi:MAG: hypothetical protein ACD_49C00086G0003 [uncultured bacterium (gcode 4)]|uniref:Uncharacterized protein n=1 Tax=uncultured bacterium (gcode 4) TaxID=1234023 RepID=K2AV89_9BACT|nr:MAG: hypothetical protein ACD_49C00086G0003 [uncultured bacterium (gcode 4)]
MTNIKKVVAGASAIAILTMNMINFTANAAALNTATAVVTGWVGVVVTGVWFPVWGTCTASITKTNAGWANSAVTVDSCTQTNATTLTIAASTIAANEYYTIAFSTTDGVFWTTTAWNTTNNVVVSARVLPILSMAISNNTVDLWVLSALAVTDSTTDTTITINTNAVGWYIVSAAASNFVGATTANVIPFLSRSAQGVWVEWFSIDVASVGQAGAGTSTVDATAGLGGVSTYAVANGSASFGWAAAWLGASVAGTTNGDTIVANYAASISPVTEADNYSTTVTYTVSGTF